jgi:23S rRNA U2552 (ribose-2'-O)-methylase RlmE/FtsJ
MIDNNKVKKIIDERIKMHLDDPRIVDKWNDLINIFTEDESETIEYLSNCSEYIVEWASEVFEDVSKSFQSEKFIKCIEALKSKFENLDLEQDIFYAKETIKKP